MDEIAANRYPSVNWKQDLRISRQHFSEHQRYGEGAASVCIAVERYLMHGALAIRKLLLQRALSDEVVHAERPVLSYPCSKSPDKRWWFEGTVDLEYLHHFVRHYDLEQPREEFLRLKRLADYMIHSFVFAVWPEDGGAHEEARVFFNSDRNQDRLVYEIRVADFSAIIDEILDDEIVWVSINKETGEFRQHNWVWRQRQRETMRTR